MAKKAVNLFHKDQLGYTFYSILYTCAYHHVLGFSALQDSMKDIDLILANMVISNNIQSPRGMHPEGLQIGWPWNILST